MAKQKNAKEANVMSAAAIQITLTTFYDEANGVKSEVVTSAPKIDGDEEGGNASEFNVCDSKPFVIKNLLVLSFGNLLFSMALESLCNLQSTINSADGVGASSLAVIYGALTASCLFLPTPVIKILGCKRTLVFCFICCIPYILANFYPSRSTLVSTAVICGVVSGPLWSSRSTYLNRISCRYANMQHSSAEVMNPWFFSVATTFRQNTEIWGSLISYFVLKTEEDQSLFLPESAPQSCGTDFYDTKGFAFNPNLHPPSNVRRYILTAIFITMLLTAVFFTAFLLESEDQETAGVATQKKLSRSDFFATFQQMVRPDQLLLLPLSLFTGLVDGFYKGEYTKAYVACAWGVPHVAAVSICYGAASALMDAVSGPSVMVLGRVAVLTLAAIAHFAMFVSLTLWKPNPQLTTGFFLVAGVHGIGNGIWMSQLVAFYGVLFKQNEEAAFSCFCFMNSLGFLVAFAYGSHLCTYVALIVPPFVLGIGLLCYLAVEIRLAWKTAHEIKTTQQSTRCPS